MKTLSPPPIVPVETLAFFFDVDGTLAEIQPHPDDVVVTTETRRTLEMLTHEAGGAVALVSGRPVGELDALVSPLTLPLAGIHGAERRDSRGQYQRITLPEGLAAELASRLEQAVAALPGTLLENKGSAFALHYRQAPEQGEAILKLARELAAAYPELKLQPGKCVVELKPQGVSKGQAIAAFMDAPPFAGRRPIFFGDDVTDEAGFRAVNALGGISVKIGDGETAAQYRLDSVPALAHWLQQTLLQQETPCSKEEKA
ncbi:trehalose-phosphatase [Pantoea sp. 1.19]|uniref:trehalose-phosphatase n=1 Tax=Pantoea sp. 1.19 TaxID=1925589 RepID=UPI0009488B85|nr:trehalose-phosphatase [Pantoea sp. 1.19]